MITEPVVEYRFQDGKAQNSDGTYKGTITNCPHIKLPSTSKSGWGDLTDALEFRGPGSRVTIPATGRLSRVKSFGVEVVLRANALDRERMNVFVGQTTPMSLQLRRDNDHVFVHAEIHTTRGWISLAGKHVFTGVDIEDARNFELDEWETISVVFTSTDLFLFRPQRLADYHYSGYICGHRELQDGEQLTPIGDGDIYIGTGIDGQRDQFFGDMAGLRIWDSIPPQFLDTIERIVGKPFKIFFGKIGGIPVHPQNQSDSPGPSTAGPSKMFFGRLEDIRDFYHFHPFQNGWKFSFTEGYRELKRIGVGCGLRFENGRFEVDTYGPPRQGFTGDSVHLRVDQEFADKDFDDSYIWTCWFGVIAAKLIAAGGISYSGGGVRGLSQGSHFHDEAVVQIQDAVRFQEYYGKTAHLINHWEFDFRDDNDCPIRELGLHLGDVSADQTTGSFSYDVDFDYADKNQDDQYNCAFGSSVLIAKDIAVEYKRSPEMRCRGNKRCVKVFDWQVPDGYDTAIVALRGWRFHWPGNIDQKLKGAGIWIEDQHLDPSSRTLSWKVVAEFDGERTYDFYWDYSYGILAFRTAEVVQLSEIPLVPEIYYKVGLNLDTGVRSVSLRVQGPGDANRLLFYTGTADFGSQVSTRSSWDYRSVAFDVGDAFTQEEFKQAIVTVWLEEISDQGHAVNAGWSIERATATRNPETSRTKVTVDYAVRGDATYLAKMGFKVTVLAGPPAPVVAQPILEVASIAYGDVPVNETATMPLELRNEGQEILYINDITLPENEVFALTLDESLPSWLRPGETHVVGSVTFSPTEEQDYQDILKIASNDPTCSVKEVPIRGTGAFWFRVRPEVVDFGDVNILEIDENGVEQSFTLVNDHPTKTCEVRIMPVLWPEEEGIRFGFSDCGPRNPCTIGPKQSRRVFVTAKPIPGGRFGEHVLKQPIEVEGEDRQFYVTLRANLVVG